MSRFPLQREALRAALPAMLLAGSILLPFLGKAFTIDDTLFLRQAEQLLRDPAHPTAFTIVWSEAPDAVRMSRIMPSGPLMAYLLLPVAGAGGPEWAAHAIQLALVLLALHATAALALRLGSTRGEASTAALLLGSTPVLLGMAGTAMPDVPAMAFGVAGVERLLAFRAEGRQHQRAAAVLGLTLAALARSHAILLVALAALLGWSVARSPAPRRPWLPLALAPLLFALALVATHDPGPGSGGTWSAAALLSAGLRIRGNGLAFGVHWLLALPLGFVWLSLHARRIVRRVGTWVGLAVAVGLVATAEPAGPWVAPLAGAGFAVLVDVLLDARSRGDAVQLALGAWLFVAAPLVVYVHLPSKYLLISAPAAALLSARAPGTSSRAGSERRAKGVLGGAVVAGAVLAVLVLRADSALAGLGRRAAAELIAPEVAAGRHVWFTGHWGFQWYAERAGARPLTLAAPRPARGDRLVTSQVLPGAIGGVGIPPCARLRALPAGGGAGGRVMDRRAGAGFYSNYWGYLPWAWSREELDRFELWEVR